MIRHPLPSLLVLLAAGTACTKKGDDGPLLQVSPEALDFGTVPVDGRVDLAFELRNAGGTEIDLLSVSLDEGEAGTWSIDWAGAATLAPGEGVEVLVAFTPELEGAQAGTVLVRTSLSDPYRTLPLVGIGGPSERDGDGDGYSAATGDCDDDRADTWPGAPELCDGVDNDCSDGVPADEADADGDGSRICAGDCDDADGSRSPGAEEICDGKDNDCDDIVQDNRDDDGDGFSLCEGDCDDAEDRSNPDADEVCDYLDNDCNGGIDDLDGDGDGFSECESGGDCDDGDPDAHPVLVDAAAGDGGLGTAASPVNDLEEGLALLDGDCNTLLIRAGDYAAGVVRVGEDLVLQGADPDPGRVRLVAPKASRVLDLSGGATATLRNLTVTGGDAAEDGGALRATGASLLLERVILDGNRSAGDGGAIAVSSGSLELWSCTLTGNQAGDDGGAVAALSSDVLDHGSFYQGNQGARGGAVVWEASGGTLSDGSFLSNEASFEGGALWIVGGGGILAERLALWDNAAAGAGGAVAVTDLSDESSILRNLWVEGNLAGDQGGGIAVTGSRSALVIANNDLIGNDGGGEGGGLWLGAKVAAGTWALANLVAWNGGDSGLSALHGGGAGAGWNMAYNNSSGLELDLDAGEDLGFNEVSDPRWLDLDPTEGPEAHDLALSASSPARDSGPRKGDGPASVSDWADPDGSRNDRGQTGGPGATP